MSDEERAERCGMNVNDYRKMMDEAHLKFLKDRRDKIAKLTDTELNKIESIDIIYK